jgi:hypothetical protein
LAFIWGTVNKSGGTVQGIAELWDISTLPNPTFTGFVGHATVWGNANGFTATFHGSNGAHTTDFHITSNVHGIQVASLSCS